MTKAADGQRRGKRPAQRTASLILITIGLLIPALSLIPLGSLWLWQHGYLIHWTVFALSAVAIVYLVQRRLLPSRPDMQSAASERDDPDALDNPDEVRIDLDPQPGLGLADALAADVFTQARVTAYQKVRDIPGDTLDAVECAHPLRAE